MRLTTLTGISRAATALFLAGTLIAVTAACTDDDDRGSSSTTAASTTVSGSDTAEATSTTISGAEPGDAVVSREQAEQAALDFIGEGEVTFVTEEDDRGAAWEVEITRPDGSEVDVLIAPDGSVIE